MDNAYSSLLVPYSFSGDNPQEPVSELDDHLASVNRNGDLCKVHDDHNGGGGTSCAKCTSKYLLRVLAAILAISLVGLVFGLLPYLAVHEAAKEKYNHTLYLVAGIFVLVTVPISSQGILQHLVNWYMPQVQKFVVRILFMVPIYSIEAWFSLYFHGAFEYLRAFRELYEAFAIASFLYYIIELLGGEENLALALRTKNGSYGSHVFVFKLVCKEWNMGREFMMNCKYGVLQYVLIKTLATIVVFILESKGLFQPGVWSWGSAYGYIAVTMNISIGYALYCLVKLYYATKDDLKDWRPVPKFLCIKGIIFFTFWQGFLIQCLHSFGVIKGVAGWDSEHVVDGIQDTLICMEMVIFAVAHRYAFPHTDYIHYSIRHRHNNSRPSSSSTRDHRPNNSGADTEALILFDQDHNVVHDPDQRIDVEYHPPTIRQLDAPLSVSRALLGSVVPHETFSDIARMSLGGTVVVSGDGGRGRSGMSTGSGTDNNGGDNKIVFSMDQAEGI
mmetsp:Transcript_14687/g.28285  ORF Transcript_14687/g.28285 Transcript_14687/m.28285 type:complete len:501 (+) Transcript_14687:92-1594(+)